MQVVFMIFKQIFLNGALQQIIPMDFVYSQKEANRIHRLYQLQTPVDLREIIIYDVISSEVFE